jgi:hypothetical protein
VKLFIPTVKNFFHEWLPALLAPAMLGLAAFSWQSTVSLQVLETKVELILENITRQDAIQQKQIDDIADRVRVLEIKAGHTP